MSKFHQVNKTASMPELPQEIWLEVMSYLGYANLKRCMQINKTFRSLTQHGTFDGILFRSATVVDGETPNIINPAEVKVHPAFESMSFEWATKLEQVYFPYRNGEVDFDDPLPLTHTAAAKEHATYPAVSRLRFQIHYWKVLEVRNKRGVNVVQVMNALCKFFDKGDYWERMGDHTGWIGFDRPRLDAKGYLLLRATSFDS